jgi:hypothetical protein
MPGAIPIAGREALYLAEGATLVLLLLWAEVQQMTTIRMAEKMDVSYVNAQDERKTAKSNGCLSSERSEDRETQRPTLQAQARLLISAMTTASVVAKGRISDLDEATSAEFRPRAVIQISPAVSDRTFRLHGDWIGRG